MKLDVTVEKKYGIDIDIENIISEALCEKVGDLFDFIVYLLEEALENDSDGQVTLDYLNSLEKYNIFQALHKELMEQLPKEFENYDFDMCERWVRW